MTAAAILQPAYLPYVGYFEMIAQADTVILLDTVQFSRQSWQQRNRIRLPNGDTVWLTVPVHHQPGTAISNVRIDNTKPWWRKHWGTIQAAYGRTPGYETLTWLREIYALEWELLADLNETLIKSLAQRLNITTPIVKASELGSTRAGRLERLIDLCRHVDADTLLEPIGGQYLQGADLAEITVEWFQHEPIPYHQGSLEWQPYLSILDTLAHTGTTTFQPIRSRS